MEIRRFVKAACLITVACLLALAGLALHSLLISTAGVNPSPPRQERAGASSSAVQPERPGEELSVPLEEQRAVIDRITDDALAVVLVDDDERELLIPAADLPPGARAGDWLILRRGGAGALFLELDPDTTAAALRRIEAKLQALRSRAPGPTSP